MNPLPLSEITMLARLALRVAAIVAVVALALVTAAGIAAAGNKRNPPGTVMYKYHVGDCWGLGVARPARDLDWNTNMHYQVCVAPTTWDDLWMFSWYDGRE